MRTTTIALVVLLVLITGLWPKKKAAEVLKEPEVITLKVHLKPRVAVMPSELSLDPVIEHEDEELTELLRRAHVVPIIKEIDRMIDEQANLISLFHSDVWLVSDLRRRVEFAQEEGATFEEVSIPLDRLVMLVKYGKMRNFSSVSLVEREVAYMKGWFLHRGHTH